MNVQVNKITLSQEQIQFYQNEGYLIIPNVLDEAACEHLRGVAAKVAAEDYCVYLNIHRDIDIFKRIMKDSNLVSIVETVQKHKVVGTNDQYLYKKPGTPYAKQSWNPHQDSAYTNAKYETYMQVHFFIDAQNKENGGLYCYPGSHKEPLLPYTYMKSWREEFDEFGISHPGWKVDVPEKYKDQRLDVVAPKGGLFLQHGNLIHGSYPNLSQDKSREQFSIAYLNEGEDINQGEISVKIPVSLD